MRYSRSLFSNKRANPEKSSHLSRATSRAPRLFSPRFRPGAKQIAQHHSSLPQPVVARQQTCEKTKRKQKVSKNSSKEQLVNSRQCRNSKNERCESLQTYLQTSSYTMPSSVAGARLKRDDERRASLPYSSCYQPAIAQTRESFHSDVIRNSRSHRPWGWFKQWNENMTVVHIATSKTTPLLASHLY